MLTRLLAFHPKTNTTLLERCFPARNRHLLAVVSIQLLAIVQSHAQPPTELSRANTQPVYEWIFVPGLIDYPSLSAPGSVWDMVWDPQQEKVLAVRARFSDDTWLWDGSDWASIGFPSPPDHARGLVHHDTLGTVYRLQGTDSMEPSITWAYISGTGWIQVDTDGPISRTDLGWAYDAKRERSVLFGGAWGLQGEEPAYTWEWDGYDWTVYDTLGNAPPRRRGTAMVYDEKNEVVVLFGGNTWSTNPPTYFGDTWTWDGLQWQQVADTGPSPRSGQQMIYDADRQKILLFGGGVGCCDLETDLWEWDGSHWSEINVTGPSSSFPYNLSGFVYDKLRQEAVVYLDYNVAVGMYMPQMWRLRVVEKWVDYSYSDAGDGSFDRPYNTVDEAVEALPPEGKLLIKPGSSSETLVISKQLLIDAPLGSAVIGKDE